MGTAYFPITITAQEGQVTLFECDCVAEVEYHVTARDGLTDWHVSNLKFEETRGEWDNTDQVWRRRVVAETWAPKQLFNILKPHIDQAALEAELVERLTSTGELAFTGTAMRADHHAAVR